MKVATPWASRDLLADPGDPLAWIITADPWGENTDEWYISTTRGTSSRFNGVLCDRLGCGAPTENPLGRFCAVHRQEHGQRLQAQVIAIIDQHASQGVNR